MTDEKKERLAKQVYATVCKALDNMDLSYQKDDKELDVWFGARGDDLPLQFILSVDAERQLIRLLSPLPFKMSESKFMEGAIATCVASNKMADGSFNYNLADGTISFRMTESFRDSIVGEGIIRYMISCTATTVDEYNDKFLAIDKGLLNLMDFIDEET